MEEMSHEEVQGLLARSTFGTLGLATAGRAYALPLFYGYDGRALYFYTRPGKKSEYLRGTDEACLAVVRTRTFDDWESVMAFGPLEEVREDRERLRAMDALLHIPLPPEFGKSDLGEPSHSAEGARVWRLSPRRVTGRKSVPPAVERDEIDVGAI